MQGNILRVESSRVLSTSGSINTIMSIPVGVNMKGTWCLTLSARGPKCLANFCGKIQKPFQNCWIYCTAIKTQQVHVYLIGLILRLRVNIQTQNICITFVQCRPNVFDVGPTLYKCYKNVLCLLGNIQPFLFVWNTCAVGLVSRHD